MSTLADQGTWATNAGFQNQVKEALMSTAEQIAGEAQAHNRTRTALAIKVLANPSAYLTQFAQAVAADATYSATIASGGASATGTDAQILSAISAAWNDFADTL